MVALLVLATLALALGPAGLPGWAAITQAAEVGPVTLITPHQGEFARLFSSLASGFRSKLEQARWAAEQSSAVVLLKGADTLVAAPDRGLLVASLGLPSLATAGTGDVLTGIVAAFLAKGMEPQLAAVAAAAAQQRASVEAPQRAGLVASDLIDALPRVLR